MNLEDKTKTIPNQPEKAQPSDKPNREEVTVTVDTKPHIVLEGNYLVSDFKKVVGVDPSKELDEVVHGELKPLNDNQHIHVKGGEVYISHARQGGSS